MPNIISPKVRFRELRERAGLSPAEAVKRMDISADCVWDIEAYDDELFECYSLSEVQRFCQAIGARLTELFPVETTESPVSASELVRLIQEKCHNSAITLEQFENTVGWQLSGGFEAPERLLEDMTIAGVQSLCRELGIDWLRVVLSYD